MKPTVPEVLEVVRDLYSRHAAGCCWHIVLDDENLDDDCVETCRKWLEENDMKCKREPPESENGGEACVKLAAMLPLLSEDERETVCRIYKDERDAARAAMLRAAEARERKPANAVADTVMVGRWFAPKVNR